MSNFLFWTDQQLKIIKLAQPVGGDLAAVQKQNNVVKEIESEMIAKERQLQDSIYLAHSYLMQHDLRTPMYNPSVLELLPTEDNKEERSKQSICNFLNFFTREFKTLEEITMLNEYN